MPTLVSRSECSGVLVAPLSVLSAALSPSRFLGVDVLHSVDFSRSVLLHQVDDVPEHCYQYIRPSMVKVGFIPMAAMMEQVCCFRILGTMKRYHVGCLYI